MKAPLTQRQAEILELLRKGYGPQSTIPSYAQVAKVIGVSSRATVAKHIAALERKGYLSRRNSGGWNYVVLESQDTSQPLPPILKRNGFTVPESLRWDIWERDNFTCLACGSRRCLTVDHIHPWQLGGDKLDPENLQTLCRSCNSSKRFQIKDFRVKETKGERNE